MMKECVSSVCPVLRRDNDISNFRFIWLDVSQGIISSLISRSLFSVHLIVRHLCVNNELIVEFKWILRSSPEIIGSKLVQLWAFSARRSTISLPVNVYFTKFYHLRVDNILIFWTIDRILGSMGFCILF